MASFFKSRPWVLLVLIQSCIICFVFTGFFIYPKGTVFCSWGDGAKNLFTLQSYVSSPIDSDGLFKFNNFAYPFGDYVFYTDNTPVFSIPMRWFCNHVINISDYTIPLFNLFILSNFLICSLLCYQLFKPFIDNQKLIFFLAVILPWVNPQVQRIWAGHFNLSLSFIVPLTILTFQYWAKTMRRNGNMTIPFIAATLLCIFTFFCHGYYFIISTMFFCLMIVLHTVFSYRTFRTTKSFLFSICTPFFLLGTITALLKIIDGYIGLRKDTAMGYDNPLHKTIFSKLFTHYSYNTFYFPLHNNDISDNYEINAYLGNIALFLLSFLFLGITFSNNLRQKFIASQRLFFSDPAKKSIFWAGILLLMISFGERYDTSVSNLVFSIPIHFKDGSRILYFFIYTAIFSSLAFILFHIIRKIKTSENSLRTYLKANFKYILPGALSLCLLTFGYKITLINFLNPFLYVHLLTNKLEHFRGLTRFNWPFYWTLYSWMGFTAWNIIKTTALRIRYAIFTFLFFAGLVELFDTALFLKSKAIKENPFPIANLSVLNKLKINPADYQAILPLPVFLVGSEDYNLTFNDEDDFSSFVMQLSLVSKLPLMASKMSRTPPIFSKELIDFVASDSLSPNLKRKLNKKPVLVIMNQKLGSDTNSKIVPGMDWPIARINFLQSLHFAERNKLKLLDSFDGNFYYSYKLP